VTAILSYISSGFLIAGCGLILVSSLGMLKFPDLFTRIHASSVGTTLGTICIVIGLVLYSGANVTSLKLAFILLFLLFTGPTSTHALARAALEAGLTPDSINQKLNRSQVNESNKSSAQSASGYNSSCHNTNDKSDKEEKSSKF